MKNIAQMMKQAQEMQQKIQDVQDGLARREVTGTSGGGMISVTLNGRGEMRNVHIEPSLLSGPEAEMVEDLIVAAFNDAKGKVEEMSAEEMGKVTGGLNLPPGMKLPF